MTWELKAWLPKCPHCPEGMANWQKLCINAAGVAVRRQFRCRSCLRYWSVPIDREPQMAFNDQAFVPAEAVPPFPEVSDERERVVRQVFALFPRWDRAKIGRALGRTRESVRQILIGKTLASVAPDLDRYDPRIMAAMARPQGRAAAQGQEDARAGEGCRCGATCHQCVLAANRGTDWVRCTIGVPEAAGDPRFAPMCSAFQLAGGV